MYEGQLNQLAQQTFNMESASLATENLRNTMATLDAMKLANKEMQKQYGKIDIGRIEVRSTASCFDFNYILLCYRACIMIWRIYWNKQMKSRNH